jgi:hypothetical protein
VTDIFLVMNQRLDRTFVGLGVFFSRVLGLFPCGFSWVYFVVYFFGVLFGFWGLAFLGLIVFFGWLWLFLCILPVYLEAPYAF